MPKELFEIRRKNNPPYETELETRERCGELQAKYRGQWRIVDNGKIRSGNGDIGFIKKPQNCSRTPPSNDTAQADEDEQGFIQQITQNNPEDWQFDREKAIQTLPDPEIILTTRKKPEDTPKENHTGHDPAQQEIIEWPKTGRLLVQAAPGSGKTRVAIARVAWLLNSNSCLPGQIWMTSFTRAAVGEIRDRLASQIADPALVNALRIHTLDSLAWRFYRGFNENAVMTNYRECMENAVRAIETNQLARDFIRASIGHLIVDEAQDIINLHGKFILAIINALDDSAGITVFSDDAQAIYDFTTREARSPGPILPELLGQQRIVKDKRILEKIHRTTKPNLKHIFAETRKMVLACDNGKKYDKIRDEIIKNAAISTSGPLEAARIGDRDDTFVLFYTNNEARRASALYWDKPHRVSRKNIKNAIVPWIGALLGGFEKKYLRWNDFENLWRERQIDCLRSMERDQAWEFLLEYAGPEYLRMDELTSMLLSSGIPRELQKFDLGVAGPVFSTIHRAKGREANTVHLILPKSWNGARPGEAARIIFVGATRAKNFLHMYQGCAKREIAPAGYFDHSDFFLPEELVGRQSFVREEDAIRAQNALLALAKRFTENPAPALAKVVACEERYYLELCGEDTNLGFLSPDLCRKLHNYEQRKKLPSLPVMDVVTEVVPPGLRNLLHKPWRTTGIMLMPRIFA